jgi:hypothetical protein
MQNDTTISLARIREMQGQPAYLRRLAADYREMGSEATADDLVAAAATIETLLNMAGLPFHMDLAQAHAEFENEMGEGA